MDGKKVHLGLRETQEHWNKMTSNNKIPLQELFFWNTCSLFQGLKINKYVKFYKSRS